MRVGSMAIVRLWQRVEDFFLQRRLWPKSKRCTSNFCLLVQLELIHHEAIIANFNGLRSSLMVSRFNTNVWSVWENLPSGYRFHWYVAVGQVRNGNTQPEKLWVEQQKKEHEKYVVWISNVWSGKQNLMLKVQKNMRYFTNILKYSYPQTNYLQSKTKIKTFIHRKNDYHLYFKTQKAIWIGMFKYLSTERDRLSIANNKTKKYELILTGDY